MSNKEKGDAFTQKVHAYLRGRGIDLKQEYVVDVGLSLRHKKKHAFDLGNSKHLIECKYFDWTDGGNNPSGKISTLNEAMLYLFTVPVGYQKMIFVKRTGKRGKRKPETLAEYYIRLYKHFIPDDVEFWEFDDMVGTARRLFN